MTTTPGERGKQGDRGQPGETGQPGDVGDTGDTGMSGDPGERGKQGDHGQAGEIGMQGEPGPSQTMRLLVLYFVMLIVFILLAIRSEINTREIEDQSEEIRNTQFLICEARNLNVERTNTLYTGLIKVEQKNRVSTQSPRESQTIQKRIDLYKAEALIPAKCGEKP